MADPSGQAVKLIAEFDAFLAEQDKQVIDVWHGGTSFECTPGGYRLVGATHERMTQKEYRERFPDKEFD